MFPTTSNMSCRLYAGGISHRARERDVEKLFGKFGRIRDVSLKNGFAFVEFEDDRDADDAVYDLNRTTFMGERSVNIALWQWFCSQLFTSN